MFRREDDAALSGQHSYLLPIELGSLLLRPALLPGLFAL